MRKRPERCQQYTNCYLYILRKVDGQPKKKTTDHDHRTLLEQFQQRYH